MWFSLALRAIRIFSLWRRYLVAIQVSFFRASRNGYYNMNLSLRASRDGYLICRSLICHRFLKWCVFSARALCIWYYRHNHIFTTSTYHLQLPSFWGEGTTKFNLFYKSFVHRIFTCLIHIMSSHYLQGSAALGFFVSSNDFRPEGHSDWKNTVLYERRVLHFYHSWVADLRFTNYLHWSVGLPF